MLILGSGGFTEVLLKNNANTILIDVGRGQLDWKLTTNKKVTIFDRTMLEMLTCRN